MRKNVTAIFVVIVMTGCGAKQSAPMYSELPYKGYKSELEEYDAVKNAKPSPSTWSQKGGTLYKDYKAREIGDLVTVRIVESSSAKNSNNTSTSKSSDYNANITSVLGLPTDFGMTDFLSSGNAFSPTVAATTNNSFTGNGAKTRSDSVSATIAARVVDVLPSGNLVIEGQREIIVDQEKQTLSVRGVVRPKDIDAANTVQSTNIADAQIRYSGDGVISDANRKGWLASFIDWIWPF
jgi:flagellar L-ring protein precursor FlgH